MSNALAILLLGFGGAQEPSPAANELPAEIRAYYADHNYVVENSTPVERQGLVSVRPGEPLDPKFDEIHKRMARVAARVLAGDPGIAMRGPSDASNILRDTNLLEPRTHEVDVEHGLALVELDVIAFWPDQMVFQVAPRVAKGVIVRPAPRPLRVARATHRWLRVDGEWRRQAVTQLLTDFQRGTPLLVR